MLKMRYSILCGILDYVMQLNSLFLNRVVSVAKWLRRLSVAQEIVGSPPIAHPLKFSGPYHTINLEGTII